MTGWHDDVFFGIHYDLHAQENDTALGSELTAENLRDCLARVRPDWIQCDCKGHPGWTSWPTGVGSTSPGVVRDSLQLHRDVCREMGIRLGMHYSGVMDCRAVQQHPDWARVGAEGRPSDRATCPLSDYDEQLMIPQMLEIVETYDVDGFWVDGENWAAAPCWCERCKAEFAGRIGIDPADIPAGPGEDHWPAWLAFHRALFVEHVRRYAEAVHARKPDCAVCSNWMYTIRQPEPLAVPVDYLSGDYMPNFGAYRAALEARLLDAREPSWDLMAWSFTRNWQTGRSVYKTALHLCQEVAEVVALGGAVMVYDKPERTGRLVEWHHDILGEVADFCRARKPFAFGSVSVSDVAVLHPVGAYYAANDPLFNYGGAVDGVEGALHALLETHRSTDVLCEDAALVRMTDYALVVVPGASRLSAELVAVLEAFARGGGHVLLTGEAAAGELPALVGAEPLGEPLELTAKAAAGWGSVYLPVGGEAEGVSGTWRAVRCTDAQPLATALAGFEPEINATDHVIATRRHVGCGTVTAVHGPVFRNYLHDHSPRLRRWLAGLIDGLGIPWRAELPGAPARLEMVLRDHAGRRMIHLVNRGAGEMTYDKRAIVDELPPILDVMLRLRLDAPPKAVTLQPACEPLAHTWDADAGIAEVRIPRVEVHDIVAVE